jgi:hypothetical protein
MTSKTTNKFSTEVRARAVRMVLDHLDGGVVDRREDWLFGAYAA